MKKLLSAILLALLLTQFAACVQNGAEPGGGLAESSAQGDEDGGTSVPTESDAPYSYTADLEAADFNGYTFKILSRDESDAWGKVTWTAEETSDQLNDSVWNRNNRIKEKYNIDISYTQTANPSEEARKFALADSDEYDLISEDVKGIVNAAPGGYFVNLLGLDGIDLSKPWWDSESARLLTISGKLFAAFTEANLNMLDKLSALFVNTDLTAKNNLESPYELVRSGKWTLDKQREMCAAVTVDVNNSGGLDEGDIFGFSCGVGSWNCMMNAAGQPLVKYGPGGDIILNYGSEGAVSAAEKIAAIVNSEEFSVYINDKPWATESFGNGESLFYQGMLSGYDSLREYEGSFGAIPFPKYDEAQENYITMMSNRSMSVSIPASATDLARTCVILEAFGAYSYEMGFLDSYIQIVLKDKLTRDTESVEMFDIIISNRVVDIGVINEMAWGTVISSFLISIRENGASQLASLAASNDEMFKTVLDNIIAQYDAISLG